ncbi:MAG: GNAT family N-acetyltransferase [Methanoregulaceae archaeon]|nr:GNAT family N-acetyltransferase [Methanoregulaceae archaeon]
MSQVLASLEATLCEGLAQSRQTHHLDGFAIYWTPDDPTPWMNYAVPKHDADAGQVQELIAAFAALNRQPRLEFFAERYPKLAAELTRAGFGIEMKAPVMTMTAEQWTSSECAHVTAASPADVPLINSITDVAFGAVSTEAQQTTTAKAIAEDRYLAALAWEDGLAVSAGFAIGGPTVREIAGVATLPEYRRRGHAGAVIQALLKRFFEAGGEVAWLTPGDAGAEQLYSKLGFVAAGTQLNMALSDKSSSP